jgi:phage major head subunit gpT-like protein
MDLTTSNLEAVFKGYKTAFQQGFSSLGAEEDIVGMIATTVPSTTAVEVYPWLKSLPDLREWIGDRVIHSLETADFSIKNRKFELTEGVERDRIDDDTFGLFGPVFQEMGRSSKAHPNKLMVELINDNPLCYDGQNLFDSDHPVLDKDGKETSVSNDMGGAGAAWYVMDLSRFIKPFIFQKRREYDFRSITNLNDSNVFMTDKFLYGVDARVNAGAGLWQLAVRSKQTLNAENYELARQRLQGLLGDYGRPLGLAHTHTMVPSTLEGDALSVITTQTLAGGGTNKWFNTSKIILNRRLATA